MKAIIFAINKMTICWLPLIAKGFRRAIVIKNGKVTGIIKNPTQTANPSGDNE